MLSMTVSSSAAGISRADGVLDLVAQPRRLLDAGAGLGAHMQLELAAVDRGEEVLPQPGVEQRQRDDQKATNESRNAPRYSRHEPQDAVVASRRCSKPCSKAIWKRTKGLRLARACSHAIVLVALAAGTSPSSAPACAKGSTTPAWRRPLLPPAARTDTRHAVRKNIGTNTMQMQSVETKAGTAICAAPRGSPLDRPCPFEIAIDVLDRHRGVVHQDADGQRQSAQGHDVDRLAQRDEHQERAEIDSGIETAMMRVLASCRERSGS